MDNNTQNPSVQSSVQQPIAQPTQAPVQQTVQVQPAQIVPQPQPPVPTGGHPEQGPLTGGIQPSEAAALSETEAVTVATDDQAAQPDTIADAAEVQREAADMQIQESQPALELSQELKDVGVKENAIQAPEEQLTQIVDKAEQPDTQTAASGISLSSPPQQVEETQKKSGIRDSLKWLASLILYQWKKLQNKEIEQKSTEQINT